MIHLIIAVACILNAMMDSIDHNKRSLGLFALWHLTKDIFLWILIVPLLIKFDVPYYQYPIILICWIILWKISYWFFNGIRIYKLDDKFKCKLLQYLLMFERKEI